MAPLKYFIYRVLRLYWLRWLWTVWPRGFTHRTKPNLVLMGERLGRMCMCVCVCVWDTVGTHMTWWCSTIVSTSCGAGAAPCNLGQGTHLGYTCIPVYLLSVPNYPSYTCTSIQLMKELQKQTNFCYIPSYTSKLPLSFHTTSRPQLSPIKTLLSLARQLRATLRWKIQSGWICTHKSNLVECCWEHWVTHW